MLGWYALKSREKGRCPISISNGKGAISFDYPARSIDDQKLFREHPPPLDPEGGNGKGTVSFYYPARYINA
ncbi:hypothetical protein LIER_17640 [Lithospermum erythrorhizon]|uniref:Uncharacterized protein n=1 Tax=Lithospermum erythrorhizon TaxID=34254 RepID=A0AAV3QC31_LITER